MFHNAVVTGACGGLGQALARELIGAGACVALVGLQRPALDALAALAPGRCAIYQPDVSDAVAMQAMAKIAISHSTAMSAAPRGWEWVLERIIWNQGEVFRPRVVGWHCQAASAGA